MYKTLFIAALTASLGAGVGAARAQSREAFYLREMVSLERALTDVSLHYRVRSIWMRLAQYSGRMHPVYPAQNWNMGQALPNGAVLLDLSVAGNPREEVTAFWLAHEYAHQVLGHPQLTATRLGLYVAMMAGTAQEDAADRWAGRFLRDAGYDVDPALNFLCDLPVEPSDRAHSPGPTRARYVAAAYGSDDFSCAEADEGEAETVEPRLQIWSRTVGDPASMDVEVNGTYVGSLSNLQGVQVISLGRLEVGRTHTFRFSNMTTYGPYGPVAQGVYCAGEFTVAASATMTIWARTRPNGGTTCGFD